LNAICGIFSPNDPRPLSSLEPMCHALGAGSASRSYVSEEAGIALAHVGDPDSPEWHESTGAVIALDGFLTSGSEPGADAVARALAADDAHFPAKLHGHFGLAAWNPGSRILRLARDPLGTRTLYCFRNPERGIAIFASELKAVLAHASVAPRIDPDALSALLAFGFVPAPFGLFRGVRKLFPGEVVEIDARGRSRERRFWSLPTPEPGATNGTRELVLERFRRVVGEPDRLGIFLSGGVDSTVALGALRLAGISDLRAFAFGSRLGSARHCEDLDWAERAARAQGVPCRPVVVEPGHDAGPGLQRVWRHFDDPVLSPNAYTRFLLADAAHEDDALLCVGGSTAGSFFGAMSGDAFAKIERKAGTSDLPQLLAHRGNRMFPFDEIRDLLVEPGDDPRDLAVEVAHRYLEGTEGAEPRDRLALARMLLVGGEKSIATQNRTARLAGVDMRHPFRDVELLARGRAIPADVRAGKGVLKTAFHDVLPEEIATRPKIGYPTYYWNGGEIAGLERALLSPAAVERAGLFRPAAVERIVDEDRSSGRKSAGKRTWALLSLQAWHAFYVEGRTELG
jgi:asparagine synthase (glutamine-hydrolysing)